jgi:hypothetical protein
MPLSIQDVHPRFLVSRESLDDLVWCGAMILNYHGDHARRVGLQDQRNQVAAQRGKTGLLEVLNKHTNG